MDENSEIDPKLLEILVCPLTKGPLRYDRAAQDDDGFDRIKLLRALKDYLEHRSLDLDWETAKAAPAEALVNSLCMALPFEPPEKQALLEAGDLGARREALVALLEIDAASIDPDDLPPMQ